jgi:hypothetical protein
MTSILKVDTIQDQSGNNIINENADTITIGASGDTVTIPSGATIDLSSATQTGVGGTNTPAFKVYLGSNQTVIDSTDTKINLNTEVYDTDSAFDSSTNYRFTVPAGKGGKYYFGYQVWYFDANAGTSNFADVSLRINGTGDNTTSIRTIWCFYKRKFKFCWEYNIKFKRWRLCRIMVLYTIYIWHKYN